MNRGLADQPAVAVSIALLAMAACGGEDKNPGGSCTEFTGFTIPIVPVDTVRRVIPLGALDPPEDVIPGVSGGFGFTQDTVEITSPGSVVITTIESTEYLVSPNRQGVTDYGMTMYACEDLRFEVDHIVSLDASLLEKLGTGNCETSAGNEETVEDCHFNKRIELAAGDPIGVAGMYQNGQPVGLDFSAEDLANEIAWLNPDRIGSVQSYHHGTCSYTQFEPTIANQYLDKATSGMTPLTRPDRCGVPNIGIADTPQGIWVREDNQVTAEEDLLLDAPNFLTLSPGVADPDAAQLFSPGVAALGTELVTTEKQSSGRLNLDFAKVPKDGTIHCYEGDTPAMEARAFLLALSDSDVLSVERVSDPCSESDPSAWAFSGSAVAFVR